MKGPWERLTLPWTPDEVYRVSTADGAAVTLGRWRPRGEARRGPVILCHGLGTNRFDLDFDERLSLARFLARRGFESWVLELRGRGLSGPPHEASFDDQVEGDVEAALRTVISTGAAKVAWVGHSKGGLLALAHLARHPAAPISALVTLGTPFSFHGQPGLSRFIEWLSPAFRRTALPLKAAARLAAPLGLPPSPMSPYLLNRDNVDPLVVQQSLANAVEDLLGGVVRQFAHWSRTGTLTALDGFDYRAGLKDVRVPLLALAGAKDLLAPEDAVRAVLAHHGGPGEVRTLGHATGFRGDYGHGDLTIGRHAPDEVFPVVAEFLERHA